MYENNTVIDTNHNVIVKSNPSIVTLDKQHIEALSPAILDAYREIAARHLIVIFELFVQAIGGIGENSYGTVLKVLLTSKEVQSRLNPKSHSIYTILKIAPASLARRAHMRVKDAYARETLMYSSVFSEYEALAKQGVQNTHFAITPKLLYASLVDGGEFIIFQDLSSTGFMINSRTNLPTSDLVVCAFRAVAKLHAMSFVLQAGNPQLFTDLITQMDENLFTTDMPEVSIEFGKKYVRLTRHMLEADLDKSSENTDKTTEVIRALTKIENNFQEICLDAVNGKKSAPYAVICHGDFWNNNILYEFDTIDQQKAVKAKLIDFQLSRYSPPVLDLVHYLYACTEKPLRDEYFNEFMQIYYDTLTQIISDYQLDAGVIYPETVFRQQLRQFGVYGFCMSAFSVPFFVSNANELPDLDKVSEAIQELSSTSESSDTDETKNDDFKVPQKCKNKSQSAADFVDEYDILTERTLPMFKRRMIGNILDLQKYGMIEAIMKY